MSRHGWGENGDLQNQSSAFGKLASIPSGSYPPACWVLPTRAGAMSARNELRGSGDIAPFYLIEGRNLSSTAAGSGDISGSAQLIISMVADLVGSGDVSGSARAYLNLAASLVGSGDIAGAMEAIAHASASVSGNALLSSTIGAIGTLAASINVTGSALSTSNVGAAVWSAMAAASNEPGSMGEKLNAAGGAADPLLNQVPGSYVPGTAGYILGTNLDGKISDSFNADDRTKLTEVSDLHGLDAAKPLVVSQTSRTAGGISQSISESGGNTTIQRV